MGWGTLPQAPYTHTVLSYLRHFLPTSWGSLCAIYPLHWLNGGVAQAGNRLTACLGKESVGTGKQFQLKSRE